MIMLVIHLLLSLPPTSVSCETSFSQMKLVKTNRRTRLQAKTLNDLMVVKLQSPGIDKFNPDEGIDKWLTTSAKPRKPGYRRTKAASKSEAAEAECISDTEDFDDEEDFEDAIDYINELCGGKDGDDTENKYEDLMSEICFN
ncbi:uncharacterized protein LOC128550296 [Mercenaria mercenaria]|uniref:uncharacterized protein LOC128550296 n=1 Tax=Mercenaria mercenaria TaxID=6596 RepID=UPI00234ED5B1|nr:uncharacterized protein LOC128550296 [Mercenaria mercenaria]